MAELSPAAQAVLDAAAQSMECTDGFLPYEQELMAVAIRTAAEHSENLYNSHEGKVSVVRVEHLLAIAAELEAVNG